MAVRKTGGHALMIGSLLAFAVPVCNNAHAANPRKSHTHELLIHHHAVTTREDAYRFGAGRIHGAKGGMKGKNRVLARRGFYGIQCVTFARAETGIQLSGNAADWWENAAGSYQRGHTPELGSVLTFRANGRMHLGHVAVVTNVVDSRQIDIDQANWPTPGAYHGVARDIRVVDVSPGNDWTAVRVELGHSSEFGSVYPTYGFIYDRADTGTVVTASAAPAAPVPGLNPPPADLRPTHRQYLAAGEQAAYDEVAEAPEGHAPLRHPVRHRHPRHKVSY